jgi:CRP-like cAMP-binding protein
MVTRRRPPQIDTPAPGIERRHELLRSSDIFACLSEPDLAYAANHAVVRRFARGQVIVQRHDVSRGLHAILEGFAKSSVDSDEGTEVIYDVLGTGAWFGEVALLDGGLESASVIATRPSMVMTIHRDAVLELVARNGHLGIAFARLLAARVRAQDRRIEDLLLYDLSTRLARTLLALAKHWPDQEIGGLRLTFPLTQTELAAILGATRVRVNLLLGAYRDAGIIRVDRAGILILSPERLLERARMH